MNEHWIDYKTTVLNQYGYRELERKPSSEELAEYYGARYYQEDNATYSKEYSDKELEYINNNIEQKYRLVEDVFERKSGRKLLELGCGEGYTLRYFANENWIVKGLDNSTYGLEKHNPELMECLQAGDIYDNLARITDAGEKFDLVWLDNVLEHVLDPLDLLRTCHGLTTANGACIVEVPNDYSVVQDCLLDNGIVESDYWVAVPDHISYFNKQGLIRLAEEALWKHVVTVSDFPIEFNLFNPNANYVEDRAKGRGAH